MSDSDNWYFSTTTTRPQRASDGTWHTTTIYPSAWTYDWRPVFEALDPVEQEYDRLIEDALDNAFA